MYTLFQLIDGSVRVGLADNERHGILEPCVLVHIDLYGLGTLSRYGPEGKIIELENHVYIPAHAVLLTMDCDQDVWRGVFETLIGK